MRDRRNTTASASSSQAIHSNKSSMELDDSKEKRYASPPPLLSLPLPVARRPISRRALMARIIPVLFGLFIFWRFLSGYLTIGNADDGGYSSKDWTGDDAAVSEPHALYLPETGRGPRWTVAIPQNASFPLSDEEYKSICRNGDVLRESVAQNGGRGRWWRKPKHGVVDPTFIDVAAAEKASFLPPSEVDTTEVDNSNTLPICARTLTYVLSPADISFGTSLLHLWLAYGLSVRDDRAFFLDDSQWAWSRYTTYFQPPPAVTTCRPAPAHHRVPCPPSAAHLVISSATADWPFLSAFGDAYLASSSPRQRTHPRSPHSTSSHQKTLYSALRTGYTALFHLSDADAPYVAARAAAFRANASEAAGGHALIGVHVRRGDRHPFEFQYNHDYLPLERYVDAASGLADALAPPARKGAVAGFFSRVLAPRTFFHPERNHAEEQKGLEAPTTPFLLASDDPDIATSAGLALAASPYGLVAARAQDRILLATKQTLDRSLSAQQQRQQKRDANTPAYYRKHVDENAGWDGGFYAGMFASLLPSSSSSSANSDADAQTRQLREFVGRAYVLDLAVLAAAADGFVCAVSSATCRVLGVVAGWEAVTAAGGRGSESAWVNVDDGRGWSWDGRA